MSLSFTEKWTPTIRFTVEVTEHIHHEETPFQTIDFYDSVELGRFFTLDQVMMANEKDEFIYHEMMIHVPLSVHPQVKHVLVIGGGDGGSVRELTRYPHIESIDMVEIDERVVRLCQMYFPITASKLSDPRVHLYFEDGLAYVKNTTKKYDLIVVDSTDPIGPGEGLFSFEFYQNTFRILNEDGILVNQHESPYFENTKREMIRAHQKIISLYPIAHVYQAFIPTYPSGHWLFGFASKRYHPLNDFQDSSFVSQGFSCRYYHPELHRASFVLPVYVQDLLNQAKGRK